MTSDITLKEIPLPGGFGWRRMRRHVETTLVYRAGGVFLSRSLVFLWPETTSHTALMYEN